MAYDDAIDPDDIGLNEKPETEETPLSEEEQMEEDAKNVYPVPEDKRLSVETPGGTDPGKFDQEDEEVTRVQPGIENIDL